MSYVSLKENFKKVFGTECDYFWKLLYNYIVSDLTSKQIANYKNLIPFSWFIRKMIPFVRVERYNTSKAVYKILSSFDRPTIKSPDSKFTLSDVIFALTQVSQSTQFGQELKKIQDFYFSKIVLEKGRRSTSVIEVCVCQSVPYIFAKY